HVLADVPGLGERGRVRDRERDVEHPGQGLGEVGLAAAGRPDQQDVGLGQLHGLTVGRGAGRLGLDALVVVVDRYRQGLHGPVLADHVLVEEGADLLGLGQLLPPQVGRLGQLLLDDLVAQLDALVADVDARTRDELLDLLLRLAAEGTLQQVAAVADPCHRFSLGSAHRHHRPGCKPDVTCSRRLSRSGGRGVSWAPGGDRPRTRSLARGRSPGCDAAQAAAAVARLRLRLVSTWSTRPYSLASSAVMILSRSMSLVTLLTGWPECREINSSNWVRIRMISRAWISMSEPWP